MNRVYINGKYLKKMMEKIENEKKLILVFMNEGMIEKIVM